MTPQKTGPRKSKRSTAAKWKPGDTRAMLGERVRRSPEEIADAAKKAAEVKKAKEQAENEKAEKTARNYRDASRLEDDLLRKKKEAENAFPRHRTGMFN
jgi:molecular chaperone GrpE (heat shock protein)